MNKKLLSLAVAAAVAAPTAAMAEAILYGKLHQSLDYTSIENAVRPDIGVNPNLGSAEITPNDDGTFTVTGNAGPNGEIPWVAESVTQEQLDEVGPIQGLRVIPLDADGNPIANGPDGLPDPSIDGENFDGWGLSGNSWRKFTTVNPLTGIGGNVNDRANRLGVKGSEDLGNGLKAIYQVEFGLSFSSNDNNVGSGNNGISYRNSFAGLAGNWGTVLFGRHDTPLKISTGKLDLFSDTMADYNGTVGFHDVRADNVAAYISPSFSGFSFMGAVVAGGGSNLLGNSTNVNDDSLASAYSLAMIYSNGPFYGSAAYEVLGNEHFMTSETSVAGKEACINPDGTQRLSCGYVDNDFSKWRLGLGMLDWNGFTLTGIYEQQDDLPGGQIRDAYAVVNPDGDVSIFGRTGVGKQSLWQIQAAYAFGNSQVKAMYGVVDRNSGSQTFNPQDFNSISDISDQVDDAISGDRETWAIGFDHNFSKRTKVYALYTDVSDDLSDDLRVQGADWNGFSLGLIHAF
jgi:predicted porin